MEKFNGSAIDIPYIIPYTTFDITAAFPNGTYAAFILEWLTAAVHS